MTKEHIAKESARATVSNGGPVPDHAACEGREDRDTGMIYVLTNPSFPQFIKIGYSDDVDRFVAELNASNTTPYSFRIYATYVTSERMAERALHQLIDRIIPNPCTCDRRELKLHMRGFFEMSPDDAYCLLETIARISGTTSALYRHETTGEQIDDERAAEESRRREPFRFSMIDLQPGVSIQYIHDPSLQIRVKDDRHVEYGGKIYSLRGLAQELKGSQGIESAPRHFTYLGETLLDLRDHAGTDE